MNAPSQKPRNYALDFLKVVATTFIVFHHYQLADNVKFPNYLNFSSNPYFSFAQMVEFFFMVSGFFAYRAGGVAGNGVRFGSYIGKKMERLLPVMACSNVVYCVLNYRYYRICGRAYGGFDLPNFWGVIVSSLGLQTGLGLDGHLVNNPNWFVGALLLAYAMYYVVSYLAKRLRLSMEWMLVFVVFFSLGCITLGVQLPYICHMTLRAYSCFSLGLLIAAFLSKYRITPMLKLLCIGGLVSSLAFIVFARKYTDSLETFVYIICPSLIILAQTPGVAKCFRHSIWQRLSEISYNVYAWHYTLMLLGNLIDYEFMHVPKPAHMYIFTAFAWLFGALSHYLLERPLRKWVPKLWQMTVVRKDQE